MHSLTICPTALPPQAAVQHGAPRERLASELESLAGKGRSQYARHAYKVLCWPGPRGLKVAGINQMAMEKGYIRDGNYNSFSNAVKSSASSSLFVHVGGNKYALAAFPDAVKQPKPTRGGGGGKGPAAAAAPGEGEAGDG